MPQKYKLSKTEHAALDDAMKALYVERGGVFVLDLDVDVDALDGKVSEFRDNNLRLKREVERFKDIDPDEYANLKAKLAQLEKGGSGDGAARQAEIEKLTAPLRAEIDAMKAERDAAKQAIARTTLEQRLWDAALPLGVREKARADYIRRASGVFALSDKGQIEARGEDGNPLFSKRSGKRSEPLTVEEWVGEWLPEEADHLFNPSIGSGAKNEGVRGIRDGSRVVANNQRDVSRNLEAIAAGDVLVR